MGAAWAACLCHQRCAGRSCPAWSNMPASLVAGRVQVACALPPGSSCLCDGFGDRIGGCGRLACPPQPCSVKAPGWPGQVQRSTDEAGVHDSPRARRRLTPKLRGHWDAGRVAGPGLETPPETLACWNYVQGSTLLISHPAEPQSHLLSGLFSQTVLEPPGCKPVSRGAPTRSHVSSRGNRAAGNTATRSGLPGFAHVF